MNLQGLWYTFDFCNFLGSDFKIFLGLSGSSGDEAAGRFMATGRFMTPSAAAGRFFVLTPDLDIFHLSATTMVLLI